MTHKNKDILIESLDNGILTLCMNRPKRLNGWNMVMMDALKRGFQRANDDDQVKAVILTGSGRYYCAGVNLGATLKFGHPKALRAEIIAHNQALFDAFIKLTKPILVAMNGHALGASVTSATLCDSIIAVEDATLSTPFSALGIPPEGCSSVMFERLMGQDVAKRILGIEGWAPTAQQALEVGLIDHVSDIDSLNDKATEIVQKWMSTDRVRQYRGGFSQSELLEVNAQESIALADAFLSSPFLKGQLRFLFKKKKYAPALMFGTLLITRPLWSRLL